MKIIERIKNIDNRINAFKKSSDKDYYEFENRKYKKNNLLKVFAYIAYNPIFAIISVVGLDLLGIHNLLYRIILSIILFVILPLILFDLYSDK